MTTSVPVTIIVGLSTYFDGNRVGHGKNKNGTQKDGGIEQKDGDKNHKW